MRRAIPGVLLLSLGIARVASADAVTLTAGTLSVYWDGSDTNFNASGNGFGAAGSGSGGARSLVFSVGQTVDISQTLGFARNPQYPAHVTTGGVTRQGFLEGTFQLSGTPFVVPNRSDGVFTTTFSIRGLLQLFATPSDRSPLFTQDVNGTGTASLLAEYIGDGQYLARGGLVLTFKPPPTGSPTPEPASLLLLGGGLAAVWQSKRLRRAR